MRFTDSYVEHTRRITDTRRGIRNAVRVDQWTNDQELGRGGFGTVFLQREKSGLFRAVKQIPKHTGRTRTIDLREVLAMANLSKVRMQSRYQLPHRKVAG